MQGIYDSSSIGPAEASLFRTSEQIKQDVIELISSNDAIWPKEIEVEVSDGTVTLKGRVRDEVARQEAEQAAREVLGVIKVDNQLEVGA